MSRDNPTITDNVVMGDIKIGNSNCSSCQAANVRIMECQSNNCGNNFCEICGPNSRVGRLTEYSHKAVDGGLSLKERFTLFRFDSGEGSGPFCKSCLHKLEQDFEQEVEEALEAKRIQEKKQSDLQKEIERQREKAARKEAEESEIAARKEAEERELVKEKHLAKQSEKKELLTEKNIRQKAKIDVEIYALEANPPFRIEGLLGTIISLSLVTLWMVGAWREIVSEEGGIVLLLGVIVAMWILCNIAAWIIMGMIEGATGFDLDGSVYDEKIESLELEKQRIDAEYELEIASLYDDEAITTLKTKYSEDEDEEDGFDLGDWVGIEIKGKQIFGEIIEFDDDEGTVTIETEDGDEITGDQDDMFLVEEDDY